MQTGPKKKKKKKKKKKNKLVVPCISKTADRKWLSTFAR
jgi:hypothetical protein